MQKIYVASDHAGFEMKQSFLKNFATKEFNIEFIDCGPQTEDRVDYPDFADLVCTNISAEDSDLGLLICGSGQGMAMRANKYPHLRAALCWNKDSATLSKEHNKAQVLCLGSRFLNYGEAEAIFKAFLKAEFQKGRHTQRVEKISKPL